MTENKVWEKYIEAKKNKFVDEIELRNELIVKYYGLVKKISKIQSLRIGQKFSNEELESYGVEGLIKAIEKFDVEKGIKFQTFAQYRILGEILDFLRSNDFVPRGVRERFKKIEYALTVNEMKKEKKTEKEVLKELGISYSEYLKNSKKYCPLEMISLESLSTDEDNGNYIECIEDKRLSSPEKKVLRAEFFSKIAGIGLTYQEREIVYLYYYNNYSIEKISKKIGVCVASVVTKHKKALEKMKEKIERNPNFFLEEIAYYNKR